MPEHSMRGNRETPSTPVTAAGRLEKGMSPKSSTHVDGESDGRIVPTKGSNKDGQPSAEGLEGRRPTKENIEREVSASGPAVVTQDCRSRNLRRKPVTHLKRWGPSPKPARHSDQSLLRRHRSRSLG